MLANPYDQIVAKAWADDWFKRRFLSNPEDVLREHDIDVPAGVRVRVVEDSPEERTVVLPPKPNDIATSPDSVHFNGWTSHFRKNH